MQLIFTKYNNWEQLTVDGKVYAEGKVISPLEYLLLIEELPHDTKEIIVKIIEIDEDIKQS